MNATKAFALALLAIVLNVAACAIGPESTPGCREDEDCDPGFSCSAGACFKNTTERTPPKDAGAD